MRNRTAFDTGNRAQTRDYRHRGSSSFGQGRPSGGFSGAGGAGARGGGGMRGGGGRGGRR
jgi:hypothetical protein